VRLDRPVGDGAGPLLQPLSIMRLDAHGGVQAEADE
jgi:hypothetical protein